MADNKGVMGQLGDAAKANPAVDRLREEARGYVRARGQQFAKSLGSKLEDVTERMQQGADGGGIIGKSAQKMAEGEGPGKAVAGGVVGGLTDKLKGAVGAGGKPKVTNIIEDIDVGVPVSVAYNQWTQFAEFPEFTKGVEDVNHEDDVKSTWRMKVFKSGRRMTTTITEQVPDRRIAWESDGDKGTTKGVVTFHPLADDLTRVLLVLEYSPGGFVEKTGNLWRAAGRRARLDLKHFRRYLMMRGEETGSWRGEVRGSEVVRSPEEVEEQERSKEESEDSEQSERSEQSRQSERSEQSRQDEDQQGEDQLDEDRQDEDRQDEDRPDEDRQGEDRQDEDRQDQPDKDEGAAEQQGGQDRARGSEEPESSPESESSEQEERTEAKSQR